MCHGIKALDHDIITIHMVYDAMYGFINLLMPNGCKQSPCLRACGSNRDW